MNEMSGRMSGNGVNADYLCGMWVGCANCRYFVSQRVGKKMPSAAEKIAAEPKAKVSKTKLCGFAGCKSPAAPGAKLQVTVLEPGEYPTADQGLVASCKLHRMCVGLDGVNPDHKKGQEVKPVCGAAGKKIYLGHAFCLACYDIYRDDLLALCKPKLTPELIITARRKSADRVKKPEQEESEEELDTVVKKVTKKAAPAPKPKGKAKAKPPPPPVESEAEEEASESAAETEEMEVPAPKKPVEAAAPKDGFEELEEELDKGAKAAAAVSQASPTGPPLAGNATIVSDPLKAAAKAAAKTKAARA